MVFVSNDNTKRSFKKSGKQVVAMTGHLSQNKNEIHTLWLDAAQAKDPTRSDWTANVAGADHYHKITPDNKKN